MPSPIPVTMPFPDPMDATDVLDELQVPLPDVAFAKPTVAPTHNDEGPVMANGCGYTASTVV
jgi:hypothetical protein